jgi:hypothetical protein
VFLLVNPVPKHESLHDPSTDGYIAKISRWPSKAFGPLLAARRPSSHQIHRRKAVDEIPISGRSKAFKIWLGLYLKR